MTGDRYSVLVDRATVAATATLGAIAGFWLGCVLAIPLAQIHLQRYLDQVATQDAASVQEAHDLLAVLRNSAKAPCSDAELAYFREAVFQSEYVKDAGRMQGGKIECSAAEGRPLHPIGQFEAGRTGLETSAADAKLAPIHDRSLKRTGIQEGDDFVLFGNHLPLVIGSLPVHLATDTSEIIAPGSAGQNSSEDASAEVTDSVTQEGDNVVGKHCSALMSNCVTATMSVGEARRGELPVIAASSILSGFAGAGLGIVLCIVRRRSFALDEQLKRAVTDDKLNLVYQPIVNLANGQIVGAEALSRWTTQDGDAVKPDVFIKLAEEHGFVGSITNFVLRRALMEFSEVFKKCPEFRLNVNVAAADLVDPGFLPMLDQVVAEAGIKPSNLVLEVTESSTASREDAMESIRMLRQRGHSIYIDDFGTGYSNLSYLLYLSVDTIKIDKAFVRAIGTDSVSVAILPQIIAMARSMNLGVVVEGIESEGQADYFSTDNLRIYGQGYLFGRPVPAREFYELLGLSADHLAKPIEVRVPALPVPGLASLIVGARAAAPRD
jgi:sensor c-di-GMP phosphodiesterase-like protein